MADALLHPLDRAYTVPEIYAWLDQCGAMVSHSFIAYRDGGGDEASRSHSPVKVGATTFLLNCHGRCAFGSVCLLVASRC